MSLLTVVQKACNRIGISEPSSVIGNSSEQIVQLLALANEEGEELCERYRWQSLQKEATFNTVAATSQGNISTIASGLRFILSDTIWNRDKQRPVLGPLAPRDWQLLQASPVTGPYDQFRIRGDLILFDPVPAAGELCAFEYITENWCESSGGTGQSYWQADDDVGVIDEKLMTAGLVWRWKQVKGFDYAEDFRKYESRVMDAMARDVPNGPSYVDGIRASFVPGIFVPQTGYGQ